MSLVVDLDAVGMTWRLCEDILHVTFGRFPSALVFLENDIWEGYENGKKSKGDYKWSISKDGELHIVGKDGDIGVYRINKDGNITGIADIEDGKREDFPKENQHTIQKIK